MTDEKSNDVNAVSPKAGNKPASLCEPEFNHTIFDAEEQGRD